MYINPLYQNMESDLWDKMAFILANINVDVRLFI